MEGLKQILAHEHLALALSLIWSTYILVVAVWILQQRQAPVATLSWLLSMAVLPVVGLGVYYLLGPRRLKRQRLRRLRSRRRSLARGNMQRLRKKAPAAPERLHQIARLVTASAHFPVSTADEVELLVGGAATFDDILDAIQTARHHIHLEYYIFEPDQTGLRILQALTQQAHAGVKVRLLLDALGSKNLGRTHWQALQQAGGEVALFHPTLARRLRPVINFRSHRKIVVIDGILGYTGGVNITDEEDKRILPNAYHDVHVRLRGPVVGCLQTVFLEDWAYALDYRRHQISTRDFNHLLPDLPDGRQVVQIMASGPDSTTEAIHRVHVAAIQAAHQRLWLTTPYFVPTEAAMLALTSAALRGVDVRLMVPERSDSLLVTAAARSYFDELIVSGVKVFEYHASMLHSKTMLADDMLGIIGTANFDNRSFRLNYEVCAIAYGEHFAQKLELQFLEDMRYARRVLYGRRQTFIQRLGDSIARLCSPLL